MQLQRLVLIDLRVNFWLYLKTIRSLFTIYFFFNQRSDTEKKVVQINEDVYVWLYVFRNFFYHQMKIFNHNSLI